MTTPKALPQKKLWISAGLKVSADISAEKAKEELQTLQQQTVKEKGCIFFEVLQHNEDPDLFILWEEWINEDALKEHFNQPHTKAYLAQALTEVRYIEKLEKFS
ncbi:antibiotic biosynthesis monooxygenase [Colwellia demingiae]|uniref:Antibiotic biosynthesis monooxygenase n=1 Tax=Colwellia demingiae TaxID=89401 RepID=A0A5C6Q5F4_9GAMM|nr:putative quinol monooxygenase [Colwellia demingiae]TWX64116.1 antibiotic biosynthesis monooxygenase [Colwellia demingiae]